jgi:hypothetical protein
MGNMTEVLLSTQNAETDDHTDAGNLDTCYTIEAQENLGKVGVWLNFLGTTGILKYYYIGL